MTHTLVSLFLCLFFSCLAVAQTSEGTYYDIPCLFWSGENYFSGKESMVTQPVFARDVQNVLELFLASGNGQQTPFAPYLNANGKIPEVIVLFLEPQLRTDQLASGEFTSVENALKNSVTSIVAPNARLDGKASFVEDTLKSASTIIANRQSGAKVIYSGLGYSSLTETKDVVEIVRVKELIKYLQSSNIFSNGVTDLLIVRLDTKQSSSIKFSSDNVFLNQVQEVVAKSTGGNYIAIFTAEQPEVPEINWQPRGSAKRMIGDFRFKVAQTNSSNNTSPTFSQLFPGWFWQGFLIIAVMFVIGGVGYWSMAQLQTPDKWENVKKVRRQAPVDTS